MARPKSQKDIEQQEEAKSLKDNAKRIRDLVNKGKENPLVSMYTDGDKTWQRITSGSLKLDRILGKGSNGYGWARGKVHGIAGPFSSGKSTLAMATVAETQKLGLCALVDTENSYNAEYAESLGVNIDELLVVEPSSTEEAFDTVYQLIKTGEIRLIVLDSLDFLQPTTIVNAESKDQFMGNSAKANNRFFSLVSDLCRDYDCTLIVISQIRYSIGGYGNPEKISGGTGIMYGPCTRIDIRRDEILKGKDGEAYGHVCKLKTDKNKAAAPQKTTYSTIIYGKGFSKVHDVLDIAVTENVISKAASWYSYGDLKVQGSEAMIQKLEEDNDFYNEVLTKIGMN